MLFFLNSLGIIICEQLSPVYSVLFSCSKLLFHTLCTVLIMQLCQYLKQSNKDCKGRLVEYLEKCFPHTKIMTSYKPYFPQSDPKLRTYSCLKIIFLCDLFHSLASSYIWPCLTDIIHRRAVIYGRIL